MRALHVPITDRLGSFPFFFVILPAHLPYYLLTIIDIFSRLHCLSTIIKIMCRSCDPSHEVVMLLPSLFYIFAVLC